jgi:tRNA(Ile)-lysidine synthase
LEAPLSVEGLARFLKGAPIGPRYWVALSGGLDSSVLLHLSACLAARYPEFKFAAAHIHHGLQTEADGWARFCAETCAASDIPLSVRHVDARHERGQSPEDAARIARYAALAGLMSPGDILLTAQHADDQAETVLLQMLRGAGPAGLAGMPAWANFGPGLVARPLLNFQRRDLHAYAVANRLRWIDDASNANARFHRNYLRNEVLPAMARRWPALARTIGRSAQHCAEADTLLSELGRELLDAARSDERGTLLIEPLRRQTPPRQRLVLRTWLSENGCTTPSAAIIAHILTDLVGADHDRQPAVSWNHVRLHRFRDELYLLRRDLNFDARAVIGWDGTGPLALGETNGTLRVLTSRGVGIDPMQWQRGPITVRYRHGGETIRLPNRMGTKQLKKLLQEAEVPPWERARTPLIYVGDRLAAVAGRWVDAAFAGNPSKPNVCVVWEAPSLRYTHTRKTQRGLELGDAPEPPATQQGSDEPTK